MSEMNIDKFEPNVSGDEAPQINEELVIVEEKHNERGTAIVLALLIMILLMGFVALAVSRTSNETVAASNDAAESRAFDAAHASLEVMTRNFNKIFETKLNPDAADLARINHRLRRILMITIFPVRIFR